jgi:hypothetical protein
MSEVSENHNVNNKKWVCEEMNKEASIVIQEREREERRRRRRRGGRRMRRKNEFAADALPYVKDQSTKNEVKKEEAQHGSGSGNE